MKKHQLDIFEIEYVIMVYCTVRAAHNHFTLYVNWDKQIDFQSDACNNDKGIRGLQEIEGKKK